MRHLSTLAQIDFFIVLAGAPMQWGGQPFSNHLGLVEMGKRRVHSAQLPEVTENRLHDLVNNRLFSRLAGHNSGADPKSGDVLAVAPIHGAGDRGFAIVAVFAHELVDHGASDGH